MTNEPVIPQYDAGCLANVVPSLMAGLGVDGFDNLLALPELALPKASRICLLLVDGMGWQLLRGHSSDAPFLSSLAAQATPITAGFPATTATNLAAIGTGLPTGQHGIVGLSFAVTDDVLINALGWNTHAIGRRVDLRDDIRPEETQPAPTMFEQLVASGVRVRLAVPGTQAGSGLTRAVLRGGDVRGTAALGDLASNAIDALTAGERMFCYAYHADLDLLGHAYGPGSLPWRLQLSHVDRLASSIAEALPAQGMLVVTADHGMVPASPDGRVDFDNEPSLQAGVRLLGGEPRARHVYTETGATDDVLAAWRDVLEERTWIASREEAIAAGWFGAAVSDRVRARIGDVVVAARGNATVIRSVAEPLSSGLVGQHGSLTTEEQLVPLLVYCRP